VAKKQEGFSMFEITYFVDALVEYFDSTDVLGNKIWNCHYFLLK